jgi:hypothetical protein
MSERIPDNIEHLAKPDERRIALASGKVIPLIEWSTVEIDEGEALPPQSMTSTHTTMCNCPDCGRDRVRNGPGEWKKISPTHYLVALHCPDCETDRQIVADEYRIDRYSVAQAIHAQTLKEEIDSYAQSRNEEQIADFSKQLSGVMPEDFRP